MIISLPTQLPEAIPNETGIRSGKSTEDKVIARLGLPNHQGSATEPYYYWVWDNPKILDLDVIYFLGGLVHSVHLRYWYRTIRAETIITQYGAPDALVLVQGIPFPMYSEPVTPAMPLPPQGYLLYISRGIEIQFFCGWGDLCPAVHTCKGLPRTVMIDRVTYFVPMPINSWLYGKIIRPRTQCASFPGRDSLINCI